MIVYLRLLLQNFFLFSILVSFNAEIGKVWRNSCDKAAVILLLKPLIPAPYASLYPDIQQAVNILEDFILSGSVPGCNGEKLFSN